MRYISPLVIQTIEKERKMAFISGPRQIGKTTFGRSLLSGFEGYFNWDIESHRRRIFKNPSRFWEEGPNPPRRIMLDEIHKYPRWKRMLKGIYDDVGKTTEMIVTGSGRLDLYQRGGDSLFGRYGSCHLHPFSVGEMLGFNRDEIGEPDESIKMAIQEERAGSAEALNQIFQYGGFPEPLFAGNAKRLVKWRKLHRDLILLEDLRDLSRIREIGLIDALAMLLTERVGSPLSVNSLRKDLNVAFNTAQNWIEILDRLYFLFEIRPYAGSLARTLNREAKVYLFDLTSVENEGARFENTVALHLKKACDAWTDSGYGEFSLHYARDREKRESDFLVIKDRKPYMLIECKLSESSPDKSLLYFNERFRPQYAFQIIRDFSQGIRCLREKKIYLCSAHRFLARLP